MQKRSPTRVDEDETAVRPRRADGVDLTTDGNDPVVAVSAKDLQIVALELVTLYREVVRLAPANELASVGPALGRALEVLERMWPGPHSEDRPGTASGEAALTRDRLLRRRASVLGPKPS